VSSFQRIGLLGIVLLLILLILVEMKGKLTCISTVPPQT